MSWGMARRPKFSNKLGIPHRSEGSDGDIQVRQTNLGAKLFGKIGGKWGSTFLSSEEEILGTSGTKIGMDSSGALSVDQINLTGKIKITSAGLKNVCVGINNSDLGQQNVLIGVDAGKSIGATTVGLENIGFQNTCIGNLAGDAIDGGYFNTVVGYGAGDEITSGDSNVCIGLGTGGMTDGGDNICIGKGATVGTGVDGNIVLGVSCSSSATGGIVLGGPFTAVTGSGGIAIGTGSTAAANGIAIGVTVSAAANDCVIGKSGIGNYITVDFDTDATWTHSSDARMKRNIQDDTLGLSFINDLKTKTFQWKPSEEFPGEWENYILDDNDNKIYPEMHDKVMHGMIAQEVKEALDTANVDTFSGWSENEKGIQQLGIAAFVLPLIKAVQELSAKLDTMQTEINNLKA